MRDVFVVKGLLRKENRRSFSSGKSQMINVIKYILAFLKYFVILNPQNAEIKKLLT